MGPEGEDKIVSGIRNEIEDNLDKDNYVNVFVNILLYMVLCCYTVSFGFQYIKRVVYVAFLIMIAPLVALTYPLDKIKDGKAQAFEVWIKEFIFNVLLQIIHLLLYFLLITSAGNLATENTIYAIVAIGALLPAEKFIRTLFGLESSTSMGQMSSALGGAAIMNSINQLGSKKSSGSKGTSGGEGGQKQVRTANPEKEDPYKVLREKNASSGTPGKSSANGKRNIKNYPGRGAGIGNLAKRYVLNKNVGMGILRGTGKIAGAVTLGSIGLAAGISTGDMKNAFTGAIGGIAAGKRVGGNLVDGGANIVNGAAKAINDIGDTYKEGKYGEEEYSRMKFDKEFKKSSEYKRLTEKYPGQDEHIQAFLNAGISDSRNMDIAMKNIKNGKYSVEKAIAYMHMAKAADCPGEVLYDRKRFREYLGSRGIPEEQADEIREGIVTFK